MGLGRSDGCRRCWTREWRRPDVRLFQRSPSPDQRPNSSPRAALVLSRCVRNDRRRFALWSGHTEKRLCRYETRESRVI